MEIDKSVAKIRLEEIKRISPKLHDRICSFCESLDPTEFPEATLVFEETTGAIDSIVKISKKLLRRKGSKNKKKLEEAQQILTSSTHLKRSAPDPERRTRLFATAASKLTKIVEDRVEENRKRKVRENEEVVRNANAQINAAQIDMNNREFFKAAKEFIAAAEKLEKVNANNPETVENNTVAEVFQSAVNNYLLAMVFECVLPKASDYEGLVGAIERLEFHNEKSTEAQNKVMRHSPYRQTDFQTLALGSKTNRFSTKVCSTITKASKLAKAGKHEQARDTYYSTISEILEEMEFEEQGKSMQIFIGTGFFIVGRENLLMKMEKPDEKLDQIRKNYFSEGEFAEIDEGRPYYLRGIKLQVAKLCESLSEEAIGKNRLKEALTCLVEAVVINIRPKELKENAELEEKVKELKIRGLEVLEKIKTQERTSLGKWRMERIEFVLAHQADGQDGVKMTWAHATKTFEQKHPEPK